MITDPITPQILAGSVLAVPPLARNSDLSLNPNQNRKLIEYIAAGGVSTFLYGGNANFYHVALSEYAQLLSLLTEAAPDDAWIIPSVGPSYGRMLDQAAILRDYDFPTAMILPRPDMATNDGVETAVRKFVEAYGKPALLYIKHLNFIDVPNVKKLVDDGLISAIKYAIVLDDPNNDPYLSQLIDVVDPKLIVSGMGEQPAIVHVRDFGLAGFTSGCVCVAPRLSAQMLNAVIDKNFDEAERIRTIFQPLEDLRNEIHPIRVLHEAVSLADIAQMGPLLPMLSKIDDAEAKRVGEAATQLLAIEQGEATISETGMGRA
jgi:dihydrodipicolinate synthase/N-acetylneuraminate lyase